MRLVSSPCPSILCSDIWGHRPRADPGVCADDVDPAELPQSGVDHLLHLAQVADVGLTGDHPAPPGLHQRDRLVEVGTGGKRVRVIEFMTFNFSILATDQIINSAAKMLYMSGGQFKIPIVFRGPSGSAFQVSSQHSQALESWFAYFPGLKVVMPSTPADAKGLLKSAIRDDDPVIFMEQERMYGNKGEVPDDGDFTVPLGVADVKREGTDATIVARSLMVPVALKAAEVLEEQGVSVEVIDPRTIRPLDIETIVNSVKKTNRVVIAEESHPFFGVSGEIVLQIMERAFDYLDAPVKRVSGADVPMPYAKNLESMAIPGVEQIVAAVREVAYLD